MTYDEAIKYIHGVSNFFCKPGLDRIRELCHGLGDPQDSLKFIHVTGTNGKGSVCAMLDSVLRTEGYKVGLFTSPYVREFNERMRVNGTNIPNDRLAELTERVKTIADKMADSPTEFELICAIAFLYFKEENCHIVVLEVGMGGKFDATNIIQSSLLSIITGVAIDHTAFLGDTIEQIATEKAGIIKANSHVLFGGTDRTAEDIIRDYSRKMQSYFYKTDYSKLNILSSDLSGTVFNYRSRQGLSLSLLGSYQPMNAAIVLDAIDNLSGIGLKVSKEAIITGLKSASWPARFEIIHKDPTVIFDGAHNPHGVTAATESIKMLGKKVVVLSGVLRDKDYHSIASSISEVADVAFTITPDSPRALGAVEYSRVMSEYGVKATACNNVSEALELGMAEASRRQTALCCLGSLYTYSAVLDAIEKAMR